MSERKHKIGCLVMVVVFLLGLGLVASIRFYKQNLIKQEYLAKEIYEVEGTFYLVSGSICSTVFMICEPPSDNGELECVVIKFIEENNIIQTMKNRKRDDFHTTFDYTTDYVDPKRLELNFVKPSKDFPIGWNRGDHSGWLSGLITDYTIVRVRIPWDATDSSDFEFDFYLDRWS